MLGSGNEAQLPDAALDQGGQRVVHHRLVIDGLELLAGNQCQWIKTRTRATRKNDALHGGRECAQSREPSSKQKLDSEPFPPRREEVPGRLPAVPYSVCRPRPVFRTSSSRRSPEPAAEDPPCPTPSVGWTRRRFAPRCPRI